MREKSKQESFDEMGHLRQIIKNVDTEKKRKILKWDGDVSVEKLAIWELERKELLAAKARQEEMKQAILAKAAKRRAAAIAAIKGAAEQRRLAKAKGPEQEAQDAYCLSKGWSLKKSLSVGVDYKHDQKLLNVEFVLNGTLELKDVHYYPKDAAAEGRKYKIIFLGRCPDEKAQEVLRGANVDYEIFPFSKLNKRLQIVRDMSHLGGLGVHNRRHVFLGISHPKCVLCRVNRRNQNKA